MKVLHLVGGEVSGGAAKGAYQLHKGLLELGVESSILTNSKDTLGDETVTTVATGKSGKLFSLARCEADLLLKSLHPKRRHAAFHPGLFGYDFTGLDIYKDADIVHLHWICGGFVNIKHLTKVNKKMVWTLRDMWPMTGGCHQAMDCDRYLIGCGYCPMLGSTHKRDLSHFGFKRKEKYLPRSIQLVGLSNWLSDCAKESLLFRDADVRTFHNNVSTRAFSPFNQVVARELLRLPSDRQIILVGAQRFDGEYKGFDLCFEALKQVKSEALVVFFGSRLDAQSARSIGRDYISLGYLNDTLSLRMAYAAADVFVASSRAEAFGKTLAEAMACGTPVVCFDATGSKDIVSHKEDGYKARPFEANDLAFGIDWVLGNDERRQTLSRNARQKVVDQFDTRVVAKRYLGLYQEMMLRE